MKYIAGFLFLITYSYAQAHVPFNLDFSFVASCEAKLVFKKSASLITEEDFQGARWEEIKKLYSMLMNEPYTAPKSKIGDLKQAVVEVKNSEGDVLFTFGDQDGQPFQDVSQASATLNTLKKQGICP